MKEEKKYSNSHQTNSNNLKEQKKHIHVILSSERYKKFKKLKKHFQQSSDVDVFRFCIDKIYSQLEEPEITLRSILYNQTDLFLRNEYLKRKHLVLDLNDIVNDALHRWIQDRRSELNLHHLPFRNELSEAEQKVAIAFIEHQSKYERGLAIEDLLSLVSDLDKSRMQSIIRKFLTNDLILKNSFDGIDYFYAVVP